jgi:hypothetical protein
LVAFLRCADVPLGGRDEDWASAFFLFVDSAEISDNYSRKLLLKEANAYGIA